MKAYGSDLRKSLDRGLPDARLFLVYGPDESGAADLASKIADTLGKDAERVELSGAQLKDDPSLLAGEAASLSLFGDARIIMGRVAGDDALGAVEMLLAADNAINPAVLHATSLTDKGKLAKLVSDAPNAMAAVCYLPKASDLIPDLRRAARDMGLVLHEDCAARIAAYTGMDRKLALMELDKLALYCDAGQGDEPVEVTPQMLDALGAETEDTAIDPAVNCILNGDVKKLGEELARIAELGLNEVGIVLAIQRRVGSLAKLAPRAADARSIGDFVNSERSIFFAEKPNYKVQLARWHGARLESLHRRLIDLHQQLLYNSQSAEILFRQEMAVIASAAARSGGR